MRYTLFILYACIIFLCTCTPRTVDRRYKDVKEIQSVDVSTWKGWTIISMPDKTHAIIRNESRAIKVEVPEWFAEVWSEGDTIK